MGLRADCGMRFFVSCNRLLCRATPGGPHGWHTECKFAAAPASCLGSVKSKEVEMSQRPCHDSFAHPAMPSPVPAPPLPGSKEIVVF